MTPGRMKWLRRLREVEVDSRSRGRVGYDAMWAGLTEWVYRRNRHGKIMPLGFRPGLDELDQYTIGRRAANTGRLGGADICGKGHRIITDPSRIQAIRERLGPEWESAHERPLVNRYSTPDKDVRILLAELESARSQAKEYAALIREALGIIGTTILLTVPRYPASAPQCSACGTCGWGTEGHTPDCTITKLRDAADRAEGTPAPPGYTYETRLVRLADDAALSTKEG